MARTYFINGDAVVVAPNWSIKDKINSRSTLSITVVNAGTATIEDGASFELFDGATKIFSGVILRVRRFEDTPGNLHYDLNVVDNSALADKRLVAKTYLNQLAGDIVADLIEEVLSEEGVAPDLKYNYSNLITNGDFSNGTTGWSHYTGGTVLSAENNTLSKVGNGTNSLNVAKQDIVTPLVTGHKYKIQGKIRVTDSSASSIVLYVVGSTGGAGIWAPTQATPIANQWYTFDFIGTITNQTGNLSVRIRSLYPNAATQNGKTMQAQEVMVLNLTALFGAGNEPSIEDCDLLLPFTATSSITQRLNIIDGPIISKAVFNYIKCSQALDYIKKVTGLNWNIDVNKKLHFFDRSTNVSPWTLDDTVQHYDFEQESNLDDYRNVQYVRGGRGRTSTQEEEKPTPKPDGESRNFIVRFPVAEKPTIEVNINSAGWTTIDPNDIGVNGLDKNKKWYFTFGSQIITQDTTETVLIPVDDIRVTYIGLRNLFAKVENLEEIRNMGTYENISVEKSITESGQAIEYGQGLIETYGEIKDTISFSTEIAGLQAGQLLSVEKSLYGIDSSFLIESIGIRPADADSIEYSVNALDGAAVGGWEEFFKELLKGNKDYAIAENEVLILLNVQNEAAGYNSESNLYITTRVVDTPLLPSSTLYPSTTQYPHDTTKVIFDSEVTLID